LNYLDLFHGIGGFALGAYWAGMKFENHYCSDIEPWCQKLYAQRFPDSIQLGDITKIDAEDLPAGEWIISGGFPCQDISIAGKGAGIHGERSGLWFEYWRLIRDLRPRFAIMENVGMLVHRGLRDVLGSLAEIGYDAEWQDIRASDVGAPHRRERIWIVAYAAAERGRMDGMHGMERSVSWKSTDECSEIDGQIPHPSLQLSHGSGETRDWRDEYTDRIDELRNDGYTEQQIEYELAGDNVADADRSGLKGKGKITITETQNKRIGNQGLSKNECGDELPIPTDAGSMRRKRTQTNAGGQVRGRGGPGNFQWWSTEPDVGRLAHGVPHRVDRLKGLGNAIVPQIAEILFRQIKELL
jgi:DNA (cytosine-5)-methyltransferase 1